MVPAFRTTAARNSSVRLLRIEHVDFNHAVITVKRAGGKKSFDVALQPETVTSAAGSRRATITGYRRPPRPPEIQSPWSPQNRGRFTTTR